MQLDHASLVSAPYQSENCCPIKPIATMIDRRRADLERHLADLRKNDEWHPFQHFVIGLLPRAGYTDVRHSNPRSDLGRDAIALTPDGKRCVVAVSFKCTKAKVLEDATRWTEDPNREDASVLLFVTTASPTEKMWSAWKPEVKDLGLELRMFHLETILEIATRADVWWDTCERLGIAGGSPGYRVIAPYDGERVRAALKARPAEWLPKRIELREWEQLSGALRNSLILGKPGAGKTTTLFMQLETERPNRVVMVAPDLRVEKVEELIDSAADGGVIVFDDAHDKPNELRALLSALRTRLRDVPEVSGRFGGVRLLIAARSMEWSLIQPPFPLIELQDLELTTSAQVVLGALSLVQCCELVRACVEHWKLEAEPRLLDLAGARAAECDATPLYVLSMLAPARMDGRLRDEHLAHLPPSVLDLWKTYWHRLTAVEQGLLRLVKLFAVTNAPPSIELFGAAINGFALSPHDASRGLDALAKALWISRDTFVPTCLDVQLEAIDLTSSDLRRWDDVISQLSTDPATRAQLHNGTGGYHVLVREPRAHTLGGRRDALLAGYRHFDAITKLVGLSPSWRAGALNNLSSVYSALAGFEATREGRFGWLSRAVEAMAEAIPVQRDLDVPDNLAISLSTLCGLYSDLASLETTRRGRGELLRKAVGAAEESAVIRGRLGNPRNLARALVNISRCYTELSGIESFRESRATWLRKAVDSVEEAVSLLRKLEFQDDLALALNSASIRYSNLASVESADAIGGWLRKSAEAVEEATRIYQVLKMPGSIAMSLNNASACYYDLAAIESTVDGRRAWLLKAVTVIEEAVGIYRELGEPSDLAMSQTNAAGCYSDLVGFELTVKGKAEWLEKAVAAVEEAIYINRQLEVNDDLAISLGSNCRVLRIRAKNATDAIMRLADLQASRVAIEEAAALFREGGDTPSLLKSLRDVVVAHFCLADEGDVSGVVAVRAACREGRELSVSMEDEAGLAFFDYALGRLD